VSGGIARDRSTTAQRSCQGSKTAAGRKRSPGERADLDGENDVVAWVDTASSTPHAKLLQMVLLNAVSSHGLARPRSLFESSARMTASGRPAGKIDRQHPDPKQNSAASDGPS
jgi:hypothetical protein